MKNRRSIRLRDYDYSQSGAYFVTICTYNKECLFGHIVNGEMVLNDAGRIVQAVWDEIAKHFNHVELDQFVIMPNHVHGVITLNSENVGAGSPRPTAFPCPNENEGRGNLAPTLGTIVAFFKYQTTKRINESHGNPGQKLWQRNYYERVIRNESELNRAQQYIIDNSTKWDMDEENPNVKPVK